MPSGTADAPARTGEATVIVLLAGGEARRFPGKLEYPVDGGPMIAQLFERVRTTGWPVYVAGKGSFSPAVDARLEAPLLIDRHPLGGPLNALLSACTMIRASRVFALAADQPRLDAGMLERLAASWRPGDEGVVPEHEGRIEPLAALYGRLAILREGFALRRTGANAMRDLVARIAVRFAAFDSSYFYNVNRMTDLLDR
ncbi:MAG: molybdenum cofactor guanylyltransferase [Candidatus Cybelea sp.]|jgi:molybdopterin-guanine dinucleotide biosynthesis protein A